MHKRTDRQRRIKRKKSLRRLRFCILIATFIIIGAFAFKFIDGYKNINQASAVANISKEEVNYKPGDLVEEGEKKELGNIESIIEYGSNGLIGAHYPVFGKKNLDTISKDLVNKYIQEFKSDLVKNPIRHKKHQYELSINYESYDGPKDIVNINFDIVENGSYLAHPDVDNVTKVYDLSKDKEVFLSDIMKGDYLNYISKISENYFKTHGTYKDNIDSELFNEGIHPSRDNYSNFILKEDKLVFIFKKYQLFSGNFGSPYIEISYLDLKDYFKAGFLQEPAIEQIPVEEVGQAALEEKPLEKDIDLEESKEDEADEKRYIDPNKPMIALTFDDGPNKKTTLPILDTLKEYDSVATFFILGNRVSSNVDILERILEDGSEIGNHSYNHKELTKLSLDQLKGQIKDTQNAVIEAVDLEPKLMRPTYGSYNNSLKQNIDMPLILWSIDTLDWQSRNAKKVTDHVMANVKDGDIILMHDIYDSTAAAVKSLVPKLIDKGYQLVTVSELYEARGQILKNGQIYSKVYKKQ